MVFTTFYFQLHQPSWLHPNRDKFIWDEKNEEEFRQIASRCYIPSMLLFSEILRAYPEFKMTLGISGTFLKHAEKYKPEVIKHLQGLYDAGKNSQVEIIDETYHNSFTSLFSDPEKKEFRSQVSMHRQEIQDVFGVSPVSFRNTCGIYNNDIAEIVADMGYKAIIIENQAAANKILRAKGKERDLDLLVLPNDKELSEKIPKASNKNAMTPQEYSKRIAQAHGNIALLSYDYRIIVEDMLADNGTLDFWINLPKEILKYKEINVANPTEITKKITCSKMQVLDSTGPYKGFSEVQSALFRDIERLESDAKKDGIEPLEKWRLLTAAEHLMSLKENPGLGAYLLTRKLDDLEREIKTFYIHKKTQKTPIIIVSPEIAKLPLEGMGEFAKYVSGKSGGMGEVVSALCGGLVERNIPVHLITLNLRKRFIEESGMNEEEWIKTRHELHPENIHLVSSSLFNNKRSAYDDNPLETAAEFQKQVINTYIRDIRSKYEGKAILHTHDWMAGGAIVAYAKLREMPTLHTVHNIHTGNIPAELFEGAGLERFQENLYYCWDNGKYCIDSNATSIKSATKVSYVGKRFLEEVVRDYFADKGVMPPNVRDETKIKYKFGSVLAIPNGISQLAYPENQEENPGINKPGLAKRYSMNDDIIEAKKLNLIKFQKKTGLIQDEDAILLYWPSRLDSFQKGIDLLENIAQRFVDANPGTQIAVVGNSTGSEVDHSEIMGRIACSSGGKITYAPFTEDLSILGYAAASDVFGASLYEPFGQIDVVGNIYGATATNRDTGGYHDKIKNLQLRAWGAPVDTGNGMLFKTYDSGGLWWGLSETVKIHRFFRKNPNEWEKQMKRIMKESRENHSLENMIAGYIEVYEELNGKRPLA